MQAILLVLSLVSTSVFASDLQPPVGAKMCVGRQYTKEHLVAHPRQKLSKLAVIVENFPKTSQDDYTYVTAKVVGEHNGKLWGNEAGCEYKKDGSLRCQIECDGGAFDLKPSTEGAEFRVMKDYYFPLFKQGFTGPEPKPGDMISLEYKDLENRAYRLFDADTSACVEIWHQYLAADHGC